MTWSRSRALLPALVSACAVSACNGAGPGPVAAISTHAATSAAPTAARTTTAAPAAVAPASSGGAAPSHTPSSASTSTPTVHDVTLAFGGDVHFAGADGIRLAADPATAVGPMASVLRGADLAMVNLETAITSRGTAAKKRYVFRAPATAFTALRDAGIDVATMANNHGEDYGPVGLQDSLAAAAAAHFPVVGIGQDADAAFSPYEVTIKGQRIAVIGATQVLDNIVAAAWTAGPGKPGLASAYDVPRLLAAVRTARATADTVVVYLHWGKELAACPTSNQRTIAQQLIDAGADVVVGSHSHVLLGAGRLGRGFVDYGLGNFVFYAGGGATAQSGVLLLTVRGRTVTRSTWVPAQLQRGIAVPLDGSSAADAVARWSALRSCSGLQPVG